MVLPITIPTIRQPCEGQESTVKVADFSGQRMLGEETQHIYKVRNVY